MVARVCARGSSLMQPSATPIVSIVMPLYNKGRQVERALRSVQNQTFSDYELVVVDDGSTDDGPSIVYALKDARVRLVTQPNAGVSSARNRGVEESRASLVAFLDADDEWRPSFLESVLRLRAAWPRCGVFATNYEFHRERGYRRATVIRSLPAAFREGVLEDYFRVAARSDPPLWTSALMVDKVSLERVGGFPPGVIPGEDLLTWARLCATNAVAYSTAVRAHHWEPTRVQDRPGRVPQFPDLVSQGLSELIERAPEKERQGLREYLALWHRMRAVTLLRLNRGPEAAHELQAAKRLVGPSQKLRLLSIAAHLPLGTSRGAFALACAVRDTGNCILGWGGMRSERSGREGAP